MNEMNRINQLFKERKENILSVYFCAGTPQPDNTVDVVAALEQHGVDMVEIGIPFSDPMADGVVIQNAATRALRNGMSLHRLFGQLKDIRRRVHIPLIMMGYLNPILQFGVPDFFRMCSETGIDGVIIPDLPFREYMKHYRREAIRNHVKAIMLVTPETEEKRVRDIDAHTDGFIYLVSSAATTGAQQSFDAQKQAYFRRMAAMQLKNPLMVGFGISNRDTFQAACAHASGAIIGSRFVSLLEEKGESAKAIVQLKRDIGLE